MAHRRQPDRDVVVHPHPHALVTHPPHLNGNAAVPPSTPGSISNGFKSHQYSSMPNLSRRPSYPPLPLLPTVSPPPPSRSLPSPTSRPGYSSAASLSKWAIWNMPSPAYENALRHNPLSLSGLTQVAGIARIKENYPKAIEYFQRVLQLQEDNGEVWSALGHCYLMQDDLQKAYSAYQQALYLLPNPKEDPKLWYGIGILYDRYGSLDHAEEAFASVLKMDKDFDKANEILFRLGIIYKQQGKYDDSLSCFDRILRNPPSPLAHADIWFQIGHVYEQQNDYAHAKDAYERVVADNPAHAKVLQQLGWLYHQEGSSFQNQELAIQFLTKSLEADSSDAQSWYLLGRAYMAGQMYNKAYEAYQQAVYRDGRNPTFWCSIGVLYFQINQFRDALDAYSRAIRINPYISEVWFDLGSLYESCNNQISDAIDAYARAAELDPGNHVISQRLQLLKTAQATGGQLPAAPGPQDVHPNAYANPSVHPPGLSGPPLLLQSTSTRSLHRSESRGPGNNENIHLPPPPVPVSRSSPVPPFRGPPPPVSIDESRYPPSHTPLAPMDVDRPHHRDFSGPIRDGVGRGPTGHQSLLLHHPVPQQQLPTEELRSSANHDLAQHSEYFNRPLRVPSGSTSPAPHTTRPRSPGSSFPAYPPPGRQPIGPAQPSIPASQRSPPLYPREPARPGDRDMAWDRRGPPPEHHRDWDDRDHRGRSEYPGQSSQQPCYASRSPGPRRVPSPMETSPRSAHHSRPHWDSKPLSGPSHQSMGPSGPPESGHWRYDPARFDARERPVERDAESRRHSSSVANSPEVVSRVPLHTSMRMSTSPEPSSADSKGRRKQPQPTRDKDSDTQSVSGSIPSDAPKKERKKRPRRAKDESVRSDSNGLPANLPASFKVASFSAKDGQDTASSSGSGNRSLQPSPTSATPRLPSRVVDEDYDEGVADALVNLSQTRPAEAHDNYNVAMHSPTLSNASRHTVNSPRDAAVHRRSTSSSNGPSPASSGASSLKRPLSPATEEMDSKRTRVDSVKRGSGSSSERHTPVPARSSPSFRIPPASHSPDSRQRASPDSHPHNESAHSAYPSPPKIAVAFPPHPRPIGAAAMALPPIATLSSSSTPSPTDDRMAVDRRSITPPSRGKLSEVMNPAADSPGSRPMASSPRSHEKKDSPSSV
ncbi:TPR-like protein [Pisolithus marmoratus]|nr:TPR-like protein [Pisolithus marmoratus]